MSYHVLITGGAGFVGSHLADELLRHGCRVRALDNLSPQVHSYGGWPTYLNRDVELLLGDIRDPDAVAQALDGVDAVFHLSAMVGVGQSMYEIKKYTSVNNLGTAVLLEALSRRPVQKLVVASSMSIYGEGLYRTADGTLVETADRTPEDLQERRWDPLGLGGQPLTPCPTPETKQPNLSSIYALSKFDQEKLCLITGRAYRIPTAALRFFNIYGPRQALSNPYTGVLAIFASRYLNGKPPLINEDGRQQRDFVSVYDIARACRLALFEPAAADKVFNVGSGQPISIAGLADRMGQVLGLTHIQPEITGRCRIGDIRHCYADISRARDILKFEPQVSLEQGLVDLASWLEGQVAVDRVEEAQAELAARGLTV